MRRINYKSDIPPLLLSLKVDENQITVPDCDFIVRFYIEGYEGRHYDCSHIGGVWSNCEPSEDGTKLVCYINNQRLGIGELCAEFHYISPDKRYSDGSQKSVVIIGSTELGVELVEDNGDAVTEAAIDVTLPFIYRTAYEIARDHGYTGTAEDFYGALASVVGISDAEKKRVTAEITRNANEQERIENEENRLNAESERVNAEAQRVRNEAIRGDAEGDRVEQEEDRKAKFDEITGFIATVRANEGNRESNERERQANEDTRITEEAKRVEAEKKRATEFEQQKLDLTGKIDRSGDEMGGDLIFTDNAGVLFRTSDGGAHTMFNDTYDVAKFTADNGDTFEFKQNETPNKNSSAVVVSANLYDALDMTLDSMGSALDGDAAYRAEAGDKIFNPDTCKIQRYNSTIGGFEDLCDPIDGKLYANKMTDYIYRWNTKAKKMVFVGGVKAYTKEEADSRFAKLDDATQTVKVKELEANNSVTAKSMWIGDEGLLLGGDGNGHLTVEQDEVITDVTLNDKLATKADDVAYGVEWNNGQPTGEVQETTVKDATKNTTVATLFLGQSFNALESELEKKANKTELDTINANVDQKVSKTDIVQSTGTSTTAVMSQKAVSDAINKLKNAGYLYTGIANPTTNPGMPDVPVFYIANGKGTYTNFGGIDVTEDEVVILYWDTAWHKVATGIASNDKLTELEQEVNTFGIDNFIIDGYINNSGNFSLNTAFRCTDYIEVSGAIRLATENFEYNNPYISVIAFYNGQKQFLSNISNVGSFTKYDADIPENATYIRVTSTNRITNPRVKLLFDRTLAELVIKTSVKADALVTTEKLEDSSITTEKLEDSSITTEKLEDSSVTSEKLNLHFYKTPTNSTVASTIQYYEQGLYDVYIDKNAIPDITRFALWCYKGTLFTQYKTTGDWINLLFKSFSEIENGKYVNFEIDGRVIGHVIFKDKTKFTDHTIGTRCEMALEVITNNVFHNGFIIPGSITDDKLAFELPGRDVSISLPDKIYAVVGDTLQLFYRGIVKAVNPYNYDILVTCAKGNQYPRYFEFTPTLADVGSIPFKITIKDNNRNIMTEKSCTIKVVNIASSPSSAKKIACFGDSLTAPGTWVSETYRRLTSTGGTPSANSLTNIDFVGAKTKDGAGYFGVGGWNWKDYTTEGINAYRFEVSGVTSLSINAKYEHNGNTFTVMEINVTGGSGNILCSVGSLTPVPSASGTLSKLSGNGDDSISFSSYSQDSANPLWDYKNNKMTFIPYANKYADGNLDIVYTLLSWNGLSAGMTDFSTILSMVKTFADTLHAEFPDSKLRIMGLQVPSVNGGMGANYGATGTSYSDRYGMVVTALNMNQAYQDFANQDNYKSFVEFVNISSQFDSEYNMPQAEATVNTRSSLTEQRGTNGVHPSDNGYMQIADVVYRNLMASL